MSKARDMERELRNLTIEKTRAEALLEVREDGMQPFTPLFLSDARVQFCGCQQGVICDVLFWAEGLGGCSRYFR